jgi:hypothetical protein
MPAAQDATLTLDPYPGSTDGHVGGVIELRQGVTKATEFTLELFCTEFRPHREISSSILWQDLVTCGFRARADGVLEVPFCFRLPAEAPHTSEGPGDKRTWTLRVSSKLVAENFARDWVIPVLGTGVQASSAVAAAAAPPTAGVDEQLHLTHDASGLTMHYPQGRTARPAAYLIAFGVACGSVAWLLGHSARHEAMMQLVCWVFGIPVGAGGLWLLGNALHVEVRRGSLFIQRRLFGIALSTTELPLSRVACIAVSKSALSEQGPDAQVFYHLLARSVDGPAHVVGDCFVGYGAALRAANRLAQLTGLKLADGLPPSTHASARIEQTARGVSPRLEPADTFVSQLVNNRQRIARYRYVGEAAGAIIFLLVGYAFGGARWHVVSTGTKTTGAIVGYETRRHTSRDSHLQDRSYAPVVEFEANNRTIRFKDVWGMRTAPANGQSVPVIYDAANPSNAMIDGGARNWVPWAPCLALGVFLALVAFRSWLASRR